MTTIRIHIWLPAAIALLFCIPVQAQSVRDMVEETVDEGLDKEKEKAKKKKEKKKAEDKKSEAEKKKAAEKRKAAEKKAAGDKKTTGEKKKAEHPKKTSAPKKAGDQKKTDEKKEDGKSYTWSSTDEPEEIPPEDKLPKRVMHEYIKLDPAVGVGYRGWYPQPYDNIHSEMVSYFTWSVDVKGRFFKFVSLKKGYYESNGISPPRLPYRSDAAKYGSYALKAAWFLLELGIPIAKAWEPTIKYETRAFTTNVHTKGDHQMCIVKFSSSADDECTEYGTEFHTVSSYETAVLGVTYYPSKNPSPVTEDKKGKKPPFFFGLGYLSYVKPYQVTIGSTTLDELLFTGRFYGGGLALGTKIGGGINRPLIKINMQAGLGASRLTKDLTLNEAAPSDWLIGYVHGTVSFQFKWAPFKWAPTLLIVPSIDATGSSFFFFETDVQEGEEFVMPNVNWDIMYAGKLSLILTL